MNSEDKFRCDLIAFAADLRRKLHDKSKATGIVFHAIEAADVAIGVFPDPHSPHGHGLRIIKGDQSLDEIAALAGTGRVQLEKGLIVGIPCDHIGETEMWRRALINSRATRHQ